MKELLKYIGFAILAILLLALAFGYQIYVLGCMPGQVCVAGL